MGRLKGSAHYTQDKIQTWDIALDWGLDPWRKDAIKYIQRCFRKDGIQDLQKAIHNLEYVIEHYDKLNEIYGRK